MGGAVSNGRNNDDLVDNLVAADYIRTPTIQKIFRAVDRADYFLPECQKSAYKDMAWKNGNLHISAPCIYSEVMEGLQLEPNLSFLNLGSGTGYLNTMVGLVIGSGGLNHGIELYPDVIEYAYERIEAFKKNRGSIDEFDLCEPRFIQGNCFCLSSSYFQYDRVYCGGTCPTNYISYVKNLIKVGGIVVMPIDDQLMQIERTAESIWEEHPLLPVSFASLIPPEPGSLELIKTIDVEPFTLQEICRTVVRRVLLTNINLQRPTLKFRQRKRDCCKKRSTSTFTFVNENLVIEGSSGINAPHRIPGDLVSAEQNAAMGTLLDFIINRIPDPYIQDPAAAIELNIPQEQNALPEPIDPADPNEPIEPAEPDYSSTESDDRTDSSDSEDSQMLYQDQRVLNKLLEGAIYGQPSKRQLDSIDNTDKGSITNRIMSRKRGHRACKGKKRSCNSKCKIDVPTSCSANNSNAAQTKFVTQMKKDKFDSGKGEDGCSSSHDVVEDIPSNQAEIDPIYVSSSDEDEAGPPIDPSEILPLNFRFAARRPTVPTFEVVGAFGDEDAETTVQEDTPCTHEDVNPYTILMRNKIQQLPLPHTLQNYLNYNKEF